MKLLIHSSIIQLLNEIIQEDYNYNLHLSFGKMYRSGYKPYLNKMDYQYVKKLLIKDYPSLMVRVCKRKCIDLYDLDFILNHRVFLSKVDEEMFDINDGINIIDGIEIITFKIDKYDILLLKTKDEEYSVEIEFVIKPTTIQDIFDPIKFLYSLFISPLPFIKDPTKLIQNYNDLFKIIQDTPWICQQSPKYIGINDIDNLTEYIMMPIMKSEKYMLYLSNQGAYLISNNVILLVDKEVPKSLYNTVIMGEWYENTFTGYDIIFFGSIDVRKMSLVRRLKKLFLVNQEFSFCEVVNYFHNDIACNINILLLKYEGVIFAPNKANYINDRTFLYQKIETIAINFELIKQTICGFNTYILKTLKDQVFIGTEDIPFGPNIPLSFDDCKFIGNNVGKVYYQFRWDSDSFRPYQKVSQPSSSSEAIKAWIYINKF